MTFTKHLQPIFVVAILVLAIVGGALLFRPGAGFQLAITDELEAVYPDSPLSPADTLIRQDVPRGSLAGAHILIHPEKSLKSFRVTVETEQGPVHGISLYRLLSVPVPENTGLDSRTEKFSAQSNPFVIRRAPFDIFEVLQPMGATGSVAPDSLVSAVRVEIPVDDDFPSGLTHLRIQVRHGFVTREVAFQIFVHEVQIPPSDASQAKYVNWHSPERIAADHDVDLWSADFWPVLETYANLMAKGRQNTFWFHWRHFFDFDSTGNLAGFHSDRFSQYMLTFLDRGLSVIQGAPFTSRINWGTDAMVVSWPGSSNKQILANSAEGEQLIMNMFDQIKSAMAANGWTSRWYQGIFDEPTREYVERYARVATLLQEQMPGLRILEATMTTELTGYVDAWCPQVQEYQKHRDFFTERQHAGDEVWVYTCLIPGGPWINRLVDQERLRQVYVGWSLSAFNLDGFLHWGLNHHRGKPFTELVVQHGDEKNFLPAGDSHIVYPGDGRPWSSQRFEAHRIGMEDFELLEILRMQDPDLARVITNKLFRAFDDYEKSVSAYRQVRRALLESIR